MSEKKNSNKVLVILVVVTLLIIVAVATFFGYYLFIKPKLGTNTTKTEKAVNEKIIAVDEIITNLSDTDSDKYIKIRLTLGYSEKKLDKEVPAKMHIIKDNILNILRNKKSEDFSGQGYDKVVSELKDKINSVLVGGKITNIYLNDFIIQ